MTKIAELTVSLGLSHLSNEQCVEFLDIYGVGETVGDDMVAEVLGEIESLNHVEATAIERTLVAIEAASLLDCEEIVHYKQLLLFALVGIKKFADPNGSTILSHSFCR
jgi:hypothetical protein